ncbi:MAG TPA: flagellar hook-length control protein FliK, partial [Stellaceae bacterium]|nr:flagellar hook-length control protein FliK [Stellaceae bacterium]
GSAGTGGISNGSAQNSGGVTLPPIAAELGTRLALGAQALLSQPSQALATLPHGALQPTATSALAPSLGAAAHGAATPDPTAVLPKLATSATLAAATPNAATPGFEAALQSAATQTAATPAAAASADLATLANSADTTAQSAADPSLGAAPVPTAVPVPAADAVPAMEAAPPPVVAASALDQVAASLRQGNKLGLSQIDIQLKPASLGAVDVRLELTHDGRVTAVISADRSDTLMQLQRGSGELQQALRDAGLQTDSGSLSFSLRGDPQTGDQSGRQPSYSSQPPVSASGDDLLAVPAAIAGASQSAHSGLLNIQV